MTNKILNIKIIKFNDSLGGVWDQFVLKSNNGTIFHLRNFLSYHIDRKFNDESLIFESKNKIIAVLPAARINQKNKSILYSHPGASYGGIIYKNLSFEESNSIIIKLDKYCIEKNISSVFMIPPPQIFHDEYNETLLYSLFWNNYKIKESYISSIIDLNQYSAPIDYLNTRKKRYVKNVDSNVKTEWCNKLEEFYPILCDNKKRHGIKPTHTMDELNKLSKLLPKSFSLLMTYLNDKPIGGTFNFIANKRVVIIFYNMIDYRYKKYHPASIQLYKTIEWGQLNGFQYLDFGVSQLPKNKNPLSPHPSLIKFKEQFSCKGMLRTALIKEIT